MQQHVWRLLIVKTANFYRNVVSILLFTAILCIGNSCHASDGSSAWNSVKNFLLAAIVDIGKLLFYIPKALVAGVLLLLSVAIRPALALLAICGVSFVVAKFMSWMMPTVIAIVNKNIFKKAIKRTVYEKEEASDMIFGLAAMLAISGGVVCVLAIYGISWAYISDLASKANSVWTFWGF